MIAIKQNNDEYKKAFLLKIINKYNVNKDKNFIELRFDKIVIIEMEIVPKKLELT